MGNLKSEFNDLPALPGWITVTSAAKVLGVSQTQVYKHIRSGALKHVFRLGEPEQDRFVIVLSVHEVGELAERMKRRSTPDAVMLLFNKELNLWHKRVKDWARQQPELIGAGVVHTSGRPGVALCDAYMKAHPKDPRPQKPAPAQ